MIQQIQPTDDQTQSVASGALPTPTSLAASLKPQAPKPVQQPTTTQGGMQTGVQTGAQAGASTLPSPASVALPNPAPPLTNPGAAPSTPSTPTSAATSATSSATAPTPPNPAGTVPTTPIDPTNDLRSAAVLPTSSPALDAARTGMVGAAGAVTGYDRNADVAAQRNDLSTFFGPTDVQAGAGVAAAPSARLTNYNSLLDDSAGKLASVDRVKLAQDLMDQFDTQQLPEHELALKKLTDQYVAKGGGKSGMVRTAYGNEDLVRQRDRDAMKKSLISSALEGSIQDQFNKTNALSGLQSGTAAQEAAQRGEARTERQYGTDVATGNVERGLSAKLAAHAGATAGASANQNAKATSLSAASNLFNSLYGEGAANRSEVRGERTNQNQLEDQSYQRAMGEINTEQQQKTNDLNRALASLSAGESGNPSGTLTSLANGSPGLDPALIAALGSSLGKKANGGSTELDALLAALKNGGLPGAPQVQQAGAGVPQTPVAAGNEPAWEY